MATEFYFTPELHLTDGRIIRDLDDAMSFAREQEARPGVDQRDEILHNLERAESQEAPCCSTRFLEMAGTAGRSRIVTCSRVTADGTAVDAAKSCRSGWRAQTTRHARKDSPSINLSRSH